MAAVSNGNPVIVVDMASRSHMTPYLTKSTWYILLKMSFSMLPMPIRLDFLKTKDEIDLNIFYSVVSEFVKVGHFAQKC